MSDKDKYEIHQFTADNGQAPLRIDKFLMDRIENISRNRIQTAAKEDCVVVNGLPVKSNYRVKPGDTITIFSEQEPMELELIPEDIPLNVVYEDEEVLVINKQAGLVMHPGYGNYTGTLVNALMYHFRDVPMFHSGEARPGIVHRIDKNTSGLVVIAKNPTALANLSKQFFFRTTDRRYSAIVWGKPKEDSGTIVGNVGRNPKDRKQMYVFVNGEDGKHAVTHYRVLEDLGYVSVVECKLETGRTHQIRVHMQFLGHPLFNDNEYGGDQILRGTRFTKYKQFIENCFEMMPRHGLHAKTLAFDHPVSGERLSFESEIPDDMTNLMEKWRNYIVNRDID